MDRNGKHLRRITTALGIHQDPAFSPDGRLIVFAAGRNDSDLALFTMNLAGKPVGFVTGGSGAISFQPNWQPLP
jgi:Tol biopolymer transport system component